MRYIVLGIEDNDVAEQLANDLVKSPRQGMPFVPQGASIVGMFAVPTKFCDDEPSGHRGRKTEAGWTRGKKYGWWVCGACKKPTKAWAQNLNAVLSSSRNLMNGLKDTLGAAGTVRQQSSDNTSLATENSTASAVESASTSIAGVALSPTEKGQSTTILLT